jgi:ribosome-associated protein
MDGKDKALLCVQQALDHKAQDLVLLDVRGISSFADYFLICSGRSSRQVQGIAERMEDALRDLGIRPLGVEGRREGHWVLMDYGDVIVHVFYGPIRDVYDLESLWSEAVRVDLTAEVAAMVVPSGQPV